MEGDPIWMLVRVDTSAPDDKRDGVAISVARSLWNAFRDRSEVWLLEGDATVARSAAMRRVRFDDIIDDGNPPPGYQPEPAPTTEEPT